MKGRGLLFIVMGFELAMMESPAPDLQLPGVDDLNDLVDVDFVVIPPVGFIAVDRFAVERSEAVVGPDDVAESLSFAYSTHSRKGSRPARPRDCWDYAGPG